MRRLTGCLGTETAVNLTLNEDLVTQAKSLTDNLSGVVESLLSGYVAKARDERLSRLERLQCQVEFQQ
jgi:antitoxin CcdA